MKKVSILALISALFIFYTSCNKDNNIITNESKSNIELIEHFYKLADNGDSTEYSTIFSDNFIDHNRASNAPDSISDKASILNTLNQLNIGFPNGQHNLDIIREIDEDRVMVYWTFTGTHSGVFFGMPGSNKTVRINGVDILKIKNEKFVEQWHIEDLLGLFAQIQ